MRAVSSGHGHIGVVGAGVVGLSTAILAQWSGYSVTIYTADLPLETTSAKAGASFKPHEVLYNDLAHEVVTRSWDHFARLESDIGADCGVRRHTHWEASSAPKDEPPYLAVMENATFMERPDVPGGYHYGWKYTTFFIDIPIYLTWLTARFVSAQGRVVFLPKRLESLDDFARLPHQTIFNCTGIGARQICKDLKIFPIKGQIAILPPYPNMDWSISADGFYVYPRRSDTVLGGTVEYHIESESVDSSVLRLMIQGNKRILPSLSESSIVRAYAGLRPYRDAGLRIEVERLEGKEIVHNYGHGGSGVTMSWGSAEVALQSIGADTSRRADWKSAI